MKEPMTHPYHIENETEVSLINDDDSVEWTGSFADFCASHKFDDGEIEEIAYYLHNEGQFGGGALASFRLIFAEHQPALSHPTLVAILEDDGSRSRSRDWPETWRGLLIDACARQNIQNEIAKVAKDLTLYGVYDGDGFSIYLAEFLDV